jgi:hypothetical protein
MTNKQIRKSDVKAKQNKKERSSDPGGDETAKTLGVLSIVFGALGGWLGLLFGIIGMAIEKDRKYQSMYITGTSLFALWGIALTVVFSVASR